MKKKVALKGDSEEHFGCKGGVTIKFLLVLH